DRRRHCGLAGSPVPHRLGALAGGGGGRLRQPRPGQRLRAASSGHVEEIVMDARWAVTVAAQRLVLGPERRGELVFSVTNSGGFDDSVAVLVEPEGEAEASWFTVDDPQREVARGATVTFPVRVEVPAQVAPGEYAVRLRCYSADSAPEEDPALSPVVVVVVPSPPEKPKRRPWWLL